MSSGDASIHSMVCVSVEGCLGFGNKIIRQRKRYSVIASMDAPLATITP